MWGLVVTVPFDGHRLVLDRFVRDARLDGVRLRTVTVGWANLPPLNRSDEKAPLNRSDEKVPLNRSDEKVAAILRTDYELMGSCPVNFTWPRAAVLTKRLEDWLWALLETGEEFTLPKVIIYDFFAVEGYFVARRLRIRSICSVPAIPGPDRIHTKMFQSALDIYHPIIDNLRREYDSMSDFSLTTISDAFFIDSQENDVWFWAAPELLSNMDRFQGRKRTVHNRPIAALDEDRMTNVLYVCLGTVVTGNLWKRNPAVRPFVRYLYSRLVDYAHERKKHLIVAIPGWSHSDVDKAFPEISGEQVVVNLDQEWFLRSIGPGAFVTHAGGNSASEAIRAGIPMLAIPFFGDQHDCAKLVKHYNLGLSLPMDNNNHDDKSDENIGTDGRSFDRKSLDLLESSLDDLFQMLDTRKHDAERASFATDELERLLTEDGILFENGDLIFGCNDDRKLLMQYECLDTGQRLCIGNTAPFSSYAMFPGHLPYLMDQYNDSVLCYSKYITEWSKVGCNDTIYGRTLFAYRHYLVQKLGQTRNFTKPIRTDDTDWTWQVCNAAIDFFVMERKCKVHLFLGPHFLFGRNKITTWEIQRLSQLPSKDLCIYSTDLHQQWIRLPKIPSPIDLGLELWVHHLRSSLADDFVFMRRKLGSILTQFDCPCEMQGRLKETKSAVVKMARLLPGKEMNDWIGFRFVHPFSDNLARLVKLLCQHLAVTNLELRERGKVWYVWTKSPGGYDVEIQLWPTIIYTCFEYEHDRIYKPKIPGNVTKDMKNASNDIREQQHILQDIVDSHQPPIPNPAFCC
jgi:hypothetical protein